MLSVEAAGNNEPLSRAPGLQARRGAQDFRRWLRKVYSPNECLWYGNVCLFFAGRKSEKELPALAAQLRAFSSLLSLPSQAQSVIKAFRRQGIGSADEFNTARFLLSRLESLSALLQVFQIFRGRAELAASRPMARLCALFRFAPQIPQTRLTLASALRRWWFLVTVCACGGKTLISRLNLFPSATCRGLTSLPPMAFAVSFRIRCRGRENRRQTP